MSSRKRSAQLDREIAEVIRGRRKSPGKLQGVRLQRHHATKLASADVWDVAMDALLEHDAARAVDIVSAIKAEHGLKTMTPAFSKALNKAPSELRRKVGQAVGIPTESWKGTDYNDRIFSSVRNGLVGIYLDGVEGVSPDRGHYRVPRDDADRIIEKARDVYGKLAEQKTTRAVKRRHENQVKELSDMIDKAVAVREGRSTQKMTKSNYAAFLRSIGRF